MLVIACLLGIGLMTLMWLVEIVKKQRQQRDARRRDRLKSMLFDDQCDLEAYRDDD
jgi:hypothetical protein